MQMYHNVLGIYAFSSIYSGVGSVAATLSAKKALSPDHGRPVDEASCIHAICYALIWIIHVHLYDL